VKLNADPRLPVPEWTLDYLRRLNARWYEVWRSLVTAVNERLTVQHNGARVGAQPVLNLIDGTGASLTVTEDLAEGRIDVEITASGGGSSCCVVRSAEDINGGYLDNSASQSETGFSNSSVAIPPPATPNTCSVVLVGSVIAQMPASTSSDTSTATFYLYVYKYGESTPFAVLGTATLTAPIYDDSGPLMTLSATLTGVVELPDPGTPGGDFSVTIVGSPTNQNLGQVLVTSQLTAFVLPCIPPAPF
jgi:hypothetical protein